MSTKKLIVLAGPTAVGKTDLAIALAIWLKTEIISCDSRQFYKEMNIGTAKPSMAQLQQVKHHFINSHSVKETYSVGDFERDAITLLDELFKTHDQVIMTGGSGLFIKAITDGLDPLPEVPAAIRERLMERLRNEGLAVLQNELKTQDPETFDQIEIQNTQRVIRALEVINHTGLSLAKLQQKQKKERTFDYIKIALDRPRAELYQNINTRMEQMLNNGLMAEVKNLKQFENLPALKTLGYKEVFDHLNGKIDESTMITLLKQNSRRYAKRQLTWFRNQDKFEWFHPQQTDEIKNYISSQIR